MQIAILLLVVVLLLLLNAFFVLAEFASVKARPTQIEPLAEEGDRRAKRVRHIQTRLDDYLSVCQVGITLASIGLGFVGEPAFAKLLQPLIKTLGIGADNEVLAHSISIALGYIAVSYLHIVLGELVPKSMAIRRTEKSVLAIALPLIIFRYAFWAPIWLLNSSVNFILWLLRIPRSSDHDRHSEDEIRVILGQSQSSGVMSFRRLLFLENVLDLGSLTVRNAMRPTKLVVSLQLGDSRARIQEIISTNRFSRYPLLGSDAHHPLGYIHVKDLYLAEQLYGPSFELATLARPCLQALENEPLEKVLSIMQRKGTHIALVYDHTNAWTGMVSLEDAVEEVIGTIEEEFPIEQPVHLCDFLSPERVLLGVEGTSIIAGARVALHQLPPGTLPISADEIMVHIIERERLASSYVGKGIAIPHARLSALSEPIVIVARLSLPIAVPGAGKAEEIGILFILLTPANAPRIHQILLSHIAGIFDSDFLESRLDDAKTPSQLYYALCTAEQTVLA